MNALFVVFTFLISFGRISAQTAITVKVINAKKDPIPYCSVTWSKTKGLVTNDSGIVIIERRNEIIDSIAISTVGYCSAKISINDIFQSFHTIILKESEIILPEIVIVKRDKDLELGCLAKKEGYSFLTNIGSNSYLEAGYLVKDYPNYSILNAVSVFIAKKSESRIPFRVRFYKNENGIPGNDLINANIIVHSYETGRWCPIVLDTLNLQLPNEGFFISIEWLITTNLKDAKLCIGQTDDIREGNTVLRSGNSGWKKFHPPSPINKNPTNIMVRAQLKTM
ncbi:MAG TPA: hypothetical protein VF144_16280 [Chitinophagaceae bacterium]